ncbi:coagulation factor VIII-like [Acropora millepora]|uniref:coagulation factor VIII-like n=1 Tax=Acropora millepora TaxID=45264 RepID=UPI001CF4625E|nr:coagulation factor VIII-like [Acropora millepora]
MIHLILVQVFVLYLVATEETIAGCSSPLGMKSGLIKDHQLAASSSMSEFMLPSEGRLHNTMRLTSLGAWCSKEIDTDQWFQIDLLRTTNVTAIASQGLEIMGDDGYWVTQYSLNYSCDGVRWFPHWHEGTSMIFQGNNDSDNVVTNQLPVPITARFIRVKPLEWNQLGTICLRLELYGCQINQVCPHPTQDPNMVVTTRATIKSVRATKHSTRTDLPKVTTRSLDARNGSQLSNSPLEVTNTTPIACSKPLGMQSRKINNSKMTASTSKSYWTRPSEGRLHNKWSVDKMSLGGWCAEDSDNDPYLQVDLADTTVVTSVATQGLPGHANLALKYKLNYSCDGIHWFEYEQGKIFHGYKNNLYVTKNKLPVPLETRLIRIRPQPSKHNDKACVRLELYGCRKANIYRVCGNKSLSDATEGQDRRSSQVSSTTQPSLIEIAPKPTRQKDVIVIVGAQDQHRTERSVGIIFDTKNFIFVSSLTLLLNCF